MVPETKARPDPPVPPDDPPDPQIDLHTHSTASDGSFTPSKLAGLVKEAGLRAWALTDHDNVEGLAEAAQASRELGLEFVPGLEISAEYPRPGWMHVLGYYVNHRQPRFLASLKQLQQSRRDRNPRIVEKLNALGLQLTMEEVQAEAGGPEAQVGRPHFAQVLLAKGHVQTIQEAFDRYLAKGRPAYAEKRRLTPKQAIKLILRARGVPVLAHPFSLMKEGDELEALLRELKGYGLAGLEIFYPLHEPELTSRLLDLAHEIGFCVVGGSDFHGPAKPDIQLGSGREGNLQVSYSYLTTMKLYRA